MKKIAGNIKNKLLKISVEQNVAFQNVQTMFLLERMVARLTNSRELFDTIIFKGGYVALRVFNSPRYTIDLDALIRNADIEKTGAKAVSALENDIGDGTWFKFEKKSDLTTLGEYGGTRLWFRCGIGEMPEKYYKSQSLHLDLAVGDEVFPAPVVNFMDELFEAKTISWKVYTVESAVAEKLHTLIVRGSENSRSKDIFDLYYLMYQCNISVLKEALFVTFSARGDTLPEKIAPEVLNIDLFLLEKGWKSATAGLFNSVSIRKAFEIILEYCGKLDAL